LWRAKVWSRKRNLEFVPPLYQENLENMTNRLEYLQKLLESSPKDSFVLFAIAKEHESMGDLLSALSFYLQLTETDPTYIGTYYHLGKLYEQQENVEDAILTYKKGIEISRSAGDRHAMSELQGALLNLEDPE
jgi:tetratricopeptide (TPR) repeat protein